MLIASSEINVNQLALDYRSRGTYRTPLLAHPLFDGQLALSWASLAKRRGLTKGEGDALYRWRGFWCSRSPESHVGAFANCIDFLIPEGSTVIAGREGIVSHAVDRYTVWGDDPNLGAYMNFIALQHEDGEWSEYCHLAKDSLADIRIGMRVLRGQPIGKTGMSGYMTCAHLHFGVFKRTPDGFQSLVPRFV